MNKQTFISKRAFSQQESGNKTQVTASQGTMSPMSFDGDLGGTTKTLSRFKKLKNPILVQKANFETPLFRQ